MIVALVHLFSFSLFLSSFSFFFFFFFFFFLPPKIHSFFLFEKGGTAVPPYVCGDFYHKIKDESHTLELYKNHLDNQLRRESSQLERESSQLERESSQLERESPQLERESPPWSIAMEFIPGL